VARLPPSRHTLHRRLRLLDRRTGRHSPLRTTFLPAALAICHSPGLPTQRRRRSDPNATSRTRSPPCGDASSSLSPGPSRDALVATRRSAKRQEFPITDAVRLGVTRSCHRDNSGERPRWWTPVLHQDASGRRGCADSGRSRQRSVGSTPPISDIRRARVARRRCSHRLTSLRLADLPAPPKPLSVDPGRPSRF
jgi:hypothetical protein